MQFRMVRALPVLMVVLFGLACCAPKYDADTDKQVTDLQLSVNQGFSGLITATKAYEKSPADQKVKDAAGYKQNTKFYDDTKSKLVVLTTRADQTSNLVDNAKVPLTKIDSIMQRTRDFHEKNTIVPSIALTSTLADLNTQFATLEGLMQVLKTGSSTSKTQ